MDDYEHCESRIGGSDVVGHRSMSLLLQFHFIINDHNAEYQECLKYIQFQSIHMFHFWDKLGLKDELRSEMLKIHL